MSEIDDIMEKHGKRMDAIYERTNEEFRKELNRALRPLLVFGVVCIFLGIGMLLISRMVGG